MPQLWLALLTFLYVDLLDCTGTLLAMATLIDTNHPGSSYIYIYIINVFPTTPVCHLTNLTNANPLRPSVAGFLISGVARSARVTTTSDGAGVCSTICSSA